MYAVTLTVRRRPKFRVPSSIDLLVTAGHQTETKTVAPSSHVCMSAMLVLRTVGIGTYNMKEVSNCTTFMTVFVKISQSV
jgi:hypothetical protein